MNDMTKPATIDFGAAQDLPELHRLLDLVQMKNGWAKPTPSLYPLPKQSFMPAHFQYAIARPALHAAGRLVGTDKAERRNLIMANPIPGNDYPTVSTLVGAKPVTVQASELSQALATGVVESFMTSGSTGYDSKVYEQVKNFYDTQAWLPKNAVIVNKAAFDALDAPTKQAVLKAALDAEVRGLAASKKTNADSLDKLKANGMNVMPPSAQLKADMKKVGDVMLKEWLDKAGPEGKALIDAYNKS